jgi:hypothetical protein
MKIIEVHGPSLADSNLDIQCNDILFITDTFLQSDLENILLKNNTPKYIVNNHYSFIEDQTFPIYTVPWFLGATESSFFQRSPLIDIAVPTNGAIFNFMINKKQINRFLCIKLTQLFKLSNFKYTWSGIDNQMDMSVIINELNTLGNNTLLTENDRSILLSPINLEPNFINFPGETIIPGVSVSRYGGNKWTWNNGVNNIFRQSAISLITESVGYQKAAIFTEKTAYAVMGLTFPIWIGGYNQAREFEKIGFDVFSDIVDHSYQQYDTLIERCYYAFEKNLRLLTDQNHIYSLRNKHMDRLKHNFDLLQNCQTLKFCTQQIATWPSELQNLVTPNFKKEFTC